MIILKIWITVTFLSYRFFQLKRSVFVDRLLQEQTNAFCKSRGKGCEWVGSTNDYIQYVSVLSLKKCKFWFCSQVKIWALLASLTPGLSLPLNEFVYSFSSPRENQKMFELRNFERIITTLILIRGININNCFHTVIPQFSASKTMQVQNYQMSIHWL